MIPKYSVNNIIISEKRKNDVLFKHGGHHEIVLQSSTLPPMQTLLWMCRGYDRLIILDKARLTYSTRGIDSRREDNTLPREPPIQAKLTILSA